MTWRTVACRLALVAPLLAALGACGSSPRADVEPVAATKPALYSRALTGAPAAAAIRAALGPADVLRLGQLLESSKGEAGRWTGAHGHELVVTPLGGFAGDQGQCRDFSIDATRDGLTERWRGSACQQADRRWLVLR